MKKLFTSTLLTVAAVPFLMAAPHAAKKVQNSTQNTAAPAASTPAPSATTRAKVKKVKKAKTTTATPVSSAPVQK